MNKTDSILGKLENVLRFVYENGLHPFRWFEESQDTAYKYAMQIALAIWLFLFGFVIFLLCVNIFTPNLLSLSSVGISLSAMLASLMVWYSIETTKRTAVEAHKKAVDNEFFNFYTQSFLMNQTFLKCSKYPGLPTEEIQAMVISVIEQYLKEYQACKNLHYILSGKEMRILSEQIWGLYHSLSSLKRALKEKHPVIAKDTIAKDGPSFSKWVMVHTLKRAADEMELSDKFHTSLGPE